MFKFGFAPVKVSDKEIEFVGKTVDISRVLRDEVKGEPLHSCTLFIRNMGSEELVIKVPFFPDYPVRDISVYVDGCGRAKLVFSGDARSDYYGEDVFYAEEDARRRAAFYYKTCEFLSFEDITLLTKENPSIYSEYAENPFCILNYAKGEYGEIPYATFPKVDSYTDISTFSIRIKEFRECAKYVLSINEDKGNTFMRFSDFDASFRKVLSGCGHPMEYGDLFAVLLYYSEEFYVSKPYGAESVVALKTTMEKERFVKDTVLSCKNSDTCFGKYDPGKEDLEGLSDEQITAVKECIKGKGRLSILTGGPGTGKTTVIGRIAKEMKAKYPDIRVCFLSPTGMAAKRVEAQTTISGVEIMTIHKFLGWGSPYAKAKAAINAKKSGLIIIDEASMLTLDIFHELLSAIKLEDVKIILVGDINQLPAIGAGNVMKDMSTLGVPVFKLTINHRSKGLIGKNCEAVMSDLPKFEFGEDFEIKSRTSSGWIFAGMEKEIGCVISPYKKEGLPCSSSDVNKVLKRRALAEKGKDGKFKLKAKALSNKISEPSVGDYVLITKTNYKKGYVNGETGILTEKTELLGKVNTGTKVISVCMDDIELGYSVTVHKSQGSEYSTVIVTLPKVSPFITRRMLYTALSRGKKKVIVYSTPLTLYKTALNKKDENRNTFISAFGADW